MCYVIFVFFMQGLFEVAAGLGMAIGPPVGGVLYEVSVGVEYTVHCRCVMQCYVMHVIPAHRLEGSAYPSK